MNNQKLLKLASETVECNPLVLEIYSTDIDTMSGTSQKTGKPYSISKQKGYLHSDSFKYPKEIEFQVASDDPSSAKSKGYYALDLNKLLQISNFNSIGIDDRDLKLTPIDVSSISNQPVK